MHNCCDVYEKKCKCGDELCPSTHKAFTQAEEEEEEEEEAEAEEVFLSTSFFRLDIISCWTCNDKAACPALL